MSRAKNAVANGNPRKYSDSTSNLNPFRPLPLKGEVCELRRAVSAVTAPKITILIMDEFGARTVNRIPRSVARNIDMYQEIFSHGVQMLIKRGTAYEEKEIDIIDSDLHPLEVTIRKAEPDYCGETHCSKKVSWLNSGEVVRKMDRRIVGDVFAV